MAAANVLPSHTCALTEREIVGALIAREHARRLFADRASRIETSGTDPAFAYPQANWSDGGHNPILQMYRRVERGNRETVGKLRALTFTFSGYNLYEFSAEAGSPIPSEDLDTYTDDLIASRLDAVGDVYAQRYSALNRDLPARFKFIPPRKCGEIGHDIDGVIVNYDTAKYQALITAMHDAGLLQRLSDIPAPRILEIGGGYGALAYWFRAAFPKCKYTIVDLPESLMISATYLAVTRADDRINWGRGGDPDFSLRFIANYEALGIREDFDLVTNTYSLSEMSPTQIGCYVEMCRHWLPQGLFLEINENGTSRHGAFRTKDHIAAQASVYRLSPQARDPLGLLRDHVDVWSFARGPMRELEKARNLR